MMSAAVDAFAITQVSRPHKRGELGADYFGTATGGRCYLLDPALSDIRLLDIAIGQSNICRFGGQLERFYPVAQHAVLASYLAPEPFKLAALLHDAAEAYLGDVTSPLKKLLGEEYARLERRWEGEIFARFGLGHQLVWRNGLRQLPAEVKAADRLAFEIECHDLLEPEVRVRAIGNAPRPDGPRIFPISSDQARQAWLRRYWTLTADSPAPSRQSHILGAEERA